MALFSSSGSRYSGSGKFQQRRRPGVHQDGQEQFGEYRFELMSMESSAPIKRVRYHVRIFNARNLRVGYLRDFSTTQQAIAAAQDWVTERELSTLK